MPLCGIPIPLSLIFSGNAIFISYLHKRTIDKTWFSDRFGSQRIPNIRRTPDRDFARDTHSKFYRLPKLSLLSTRCTNFQLDHGFLCGLRFRLFWYLSTSSVRGTLETVSLDLFRAIKTVILAALALCVSHFFFVHVSDIAHRSEQTFSGEKFRSSRPKRHASHRN